MKIRNGFVSNSSSSSFCIYGISIEEEDLKKLAEKLSVSVDEDYIDTYSLEKKLVEKEYTVTIQDMMGEYFYIGRSYSSIKDDETGQQFKETIEKEITELLGEAKEIKCGTCEQAWYNG